MPQATPVSLLANISISDEEVVTRVLAGETALFEILMRRHNQRLYRIVRGIVRNDTQSEDIMQDAYVRAYEHLSQYRGQAAFAAWLTRIAVNEALGRLRGITRFEELKEGDDSMDRFPASQPTPEQVAIQSELQRLLESLVDALPDGNRAVFIMRDVEGMDTTETAHALSITEDNVKVRLHRARATLRQGLSDLADSHVRSAFQFHATRCDRVVHSVFERLAN